MSHGYKSSIVGAILVADVIPQLSQVIERAGERLALAYAETGRGVHSGNRYDAKLDLIFALADYMAQSQLDHDEDYVYGHMTPHELADQEYARQWFEDYCNTDSLPTLDEEAEARISAAIAQDEADRAAMRQGVQAAPAPTVAAPAAGPKPVKAAYLVSRDTDITEEGIAQAVLYPPLRASLDQYSVELAENYSPLGVNEQGQRTYDLVKGAKNARRALVISFLSWLQTDPALADAGTELALLD